MMKKRLKPVGMSVAMNLLLQVVTILCGFILPRLIIRRFGSEVNGMVSSITQFLGYITLLEAGMGSVVKASLYKPLSEKDYNALSRIIKATGYFFRKIAYVFIVYLLILSASYKFISSAEVSWLFSASLVLILGLSIFIQYYFGITYQIMLQADQKHWFTSGLQIITLILNTALTVILVKVGCSIHIVKLVSAFVFMIRPLCYNIYVKKKYKITSDVEPDNAAISQRWSGLGHHIAYFIHTNTDIVLITLFLSVKDVSVYSVYYMVVNGVKSLVNSVSAAIEPYFGNMLAEKDERKIQSAFTLYEMFNYFTVTVMFTTAAVLIVPFVRIYTAGVTDVNYILPLFATILTLAEGCYSLRNPYSGIIFASGHFKQTRNGAFLEAGLNIVLSLILVKPLGLVGVALGTLVSMLLRAMQYIYYLSKNILYRKLRYAVKNFITLILSAATGGFLSTVISFEVETYFDWILLALGNFAVIFAAAASIFSLFNYKKLVHFIKSRRN